MQYFGLKLCLNLLGELEFPFTTYYITYKSHI